MRSKSWFSGLLRHRVILQQPVDTADGQGGATRAWQDVATVSAQIIPLAADEKLQSGQLIHITTHRFTIRYRTGIDSSMRIIFNGRIFRIVSVQVPEEISHRMILHTCEEQPV